MKIKKIHIYDFRCFDCNTSKDNWIKQNISFGDDKNQSDTSIVDVNNEDKIKCPQCGSFNTTYSMKRESDH